MKYDYTTNSQSLTRTFLSERLAECEDPQKSLTFGLCATDLVQSSLPSQRKRPGARTQRRRSRRESPSSLCWPWEGTRLVNACLGSWNDKKSSVNIIYWRPTTNVRKRTVFLNECRVGEKNGRILNSFDRSFWLLPHFHLLLAPRFYDELDAVQPTFGAKKLSSCYLKARHTLGHLT